MTSPQKILALGSVLALLPVLGFPGSWKDVFLVCIGGWLVLHALYLKFWPSFKSVIISASSLNEKAKDEVITETYSESWRSKSPGSLADKQ
ncbi:MAG: hypothetical protein Q8P52_02205 [bacterium]|nr:hypothetical protein [bacterium]